MHKINETSLTKLDVHQQVIIRFLSYGYLMDFELTPGL